ncbi:acyl- n-acyltransferase [Trichoderma arundinaceum]|uniref:Acyl-n-acyltransferase n=1 Tax=Trichoderma arundinaceum TaxID=490622 RepID=A0A395NWV6_TRIAR|nr:acyl- n-acyltransferase [Trichoderma arundinaceum]
MTTPSTTTNIRVEPAREEDMPRCMEILLNAFSPFPIMKIIGGDNTVENRKVTAKQHLRAWKEHLDEYPSVSPGIKCVYTDPATGEETIIGFAEWFVWDRERTEKEYMRENYLMRLEWVEDVDKREHCLGLMQPEIDMRRGLMKGRPFALLAYMCVDPEYRRRGAATACVQWGMDRCAELGVPAYLEASEEGMKTYRSLGWEVYRGDGSAELQFPPMMWWPPNVSRS